MVPQPDDTQNKLNPKVLELGVLDDIRTLLYDIRKIGLDAQAQGIVEAMEPLLITPERRRVLAHNGPWMSVAIINDGADSVDCIVNTEKSFNEHVIAANETETVDMHRPIIKDVLLWAHTAGGSASVRLVAVR